MNFRALTSKLLALFIVASTSVCALQVDEALIQKLRGKRMPDAVKELTAKKQAIKPAAAPQESNRDFQNFIGFWELETMDDWANLVLIEFYEDDGAPKAKFYGGTQNHIREINDADFLIGQVYGYQELFAAPPGDYNICDVDVIDPTSLRLLNTFSEGYLSSDQLTTTFKIQSYDNNSAYLDMWSLWDGVADDRSLGNIETLMKFKRLHSRPEIQTLDQPTTEWDSPVNIFNYMYDVYTHLGENERRDAADCEQYIGNTAFSQLRDQLLTTGVVRTNLISTEKRKGNYIGVWRTQNNSGVTTLHLAQQNYFLIVDIVTISGFTGAYSVLNGDHEVSLRYKGSVGAPYGDDWVLPGSTVPTLHINFDSSGISEKYNPYVHGIAMITALHGPVTEDTEYRELMTAVGDLMTAFGSATHTNLRTYVQFDPLKIIYTYDELATLISEDNFDFFSMRGRSRGQLNGRDYIYMNPALNPAGADSPNFDVNDPFGLGQEVFNPALGSKWDHDIDLDNYMEASFNIWYAVTGPILQDEPITSELFDLLGSNGSQVHFTAAKRGKVPAPLVDAFGVHPYNLYQSTLLGDETSANQFVGGIVKRSYTKGKHKKNEVVAYIRWRNELGFEPLGLGFRPVVFGRNDMPNAKRNSNEIAAMAALLEKLNKYKPTRYIIDIRENDGGVGAFGTAYGTLFGGNRGSVSTILSLDYANDPEKTKLVTNSSIETVNESAVPNAHASAIVDTDTTAKVFPKAIVRGKECKCVDVVILTNINAASAGDMFSHNFIGSNDNPKDGIQYLGHNVRSQIVGSIDGRLYNGLGYGNTPISNPNPYTYYGTNLPLIPFSYEAGILLADDEHGIVCNQQNWTKPSKLVPSWYEKQWQDIGVIKPVYKYPLTAKKQKPDINKNTTWRDLALEYAITHKQP